MSSFLGHVDFSRRFIKDFSKIAHPICKILEKESNFEFDGECVREFNNLKEKIVSASIIMDPNWSQPFEFMCDASRFTLGAMLGQRKEKIFHPIYYASKSLNDTQRNYTVTEQELLAVFYGFEKF